MHTYATTDQVNDALAEIEGRTTAGRPYFIWLALSAPHSPYQLPPLNLAHATTALPADRRARAGPTMRR